MNFVFPVKKTSSRFLVMVTAAIFIKGNSHETLKNFAAIKSVIAGFMKKCYT